LIYSFLTARTQVVKCNDKFSAYINASIVRGWGIGHMLYAVMESDLRTLSPKNIVEEYCGKVCR